MINVRYNYLIEDDKDLMDSKYDIENRVDPDSSSKTLYEDVKTVFFANDNSKVLRQKYKNKPEFYTSQIAITSWTPSTRQSSCRFGQVHLQRLHPGFGIPEFFSEDSYTRSRYLRFVGL